MKKIFLILLVCMFIPLISSETSFFIEKNTKYDLKFACDFDGAICSSGASCNITINYPNSTTLISNNETTNLNNGYFNKTLSETQTNTNGEYQACVFCSDKGINGTSCFVYEVNPPGIRPSDQKTTSISRGIWFFFVIGILLFIAFLFVKSSVPTRWTFFILSIIFFLIGLNIIFVGLQDEVVNPRLETFFDSFTAISFVMYWFMGGLLIIMWLFTFLNTWLYKKNLKNAQRFGGEY